LLRFHPGCTEQEWLSDLKLVADRLSGHRPLDNYDCTWREAPARSKERSLRKSSTVLKGESLKENGERVVLVTREEG
jgi:hypothetical protein